MIFHRGSSRALLYHIFIQIDLIQSTDPEFPSKGTLTRLNKLFIFIGPNNCLSIIYFLTLKFLFLIKLNIKIKSSKQAQRIWLHIAPSAVSTEVHISLQAWRAGL